MKLEGWLLEVWYGDRSTGWWLSPLGWLMQGVTSVRRKLYQHGWLGRTTINVPVIVVGNITVGGTGKTPLVIWLARKLSQSGLQVGVLTRGYRSNQHRRTPVAVSGSAEPDEVGDEAVLIARETSAHVVAGSQRVSAARQLEAKGVQVIVCDDGLQHYRLNRDMEIAVVDGMRGFGNGRLLPAGPLRESPERLQSVSAVVVNGQATDLWPDALAMQVTGEQIVALSGGEKRPLTQMAGKRVHAVAGIGNPARFFELLERHQIKIQRHVFPDHAHYVAADLKFEEDVPILMTEKDAVKCAAFATSQMWSVPVRAQFSSADETTLCRLVSKETGLNLSGAPNDGI